MACQPPSVPTSFPSPGSNFSGFWWGNMDVSAILKNIFCHKNTRKTAFFAKKAKKLWAGLESFRKFGKKRGKNKKYCQRKRRIREKKGRKWKILGKLTNWNRKFWAKNRKKSRRDDYCLFCEAFWTLREKNAEGKKWIGKKISKKGKTLNF